MKPVCVPCKRFFRSEKTGFYFIEGMPVHNGALPGNREPDSWKPYKVWSGDKWRCPDCGACIVSGFGASPIAVQHQEDFANVAEILNAYQLCVNDC